MMEQERQGYTQILPSSRAMRSGWFTNYPYGGVRASLTPCFNHEDPLSCPDFSVMEQMTWRIGNQGSMVQKNGKDG